jgi:phosphoglycolate phosphatase-like HAD superfamily hydrolase
LDLGDTIIETLPVEQHAKGTQDEQVRFMPGARAFLTELKSHQYKVGVISNAPESWGKTLGSKIRHLKDYIKHRWRDREKIRWSEFDAGILLPPTDAERKPAPYLFVQAREHAAAHGCKAVFIGENAQEIEAAKAAGLYAFLADPSRKPGKVPYIPIAQLDRLAASQ